MTFLQSYILYLLVLAAIPVILWLLFRRRKNEVRWGATYILRLTIQSKKQQNLWRQVIIISLRTLLLAALVCAFARPFLSQDPGKGISEYPHGSGTLHRVVLFDNSLSMTAKFGPLSRLDQARQALAGLASSTRPGDVFHIVPLCPDINGKIVPIVVSVPLSNDAALKIASQIEVSPKPIDFAAGLRTSVQVFREVHSDQSQMIVLSDLCRVDHESIGDDEVFGKMLAALKVRVATLNFGSHDAGNLAVESVTAGSELLFAKQPTNVYVDIMNYSDAPSDGQALTFLIDGQPSKDLVVALPAGFKKTFTFPVELTAGPHKLEARLTGDAFTADDSIERFIHVTGNLKVLILGPKETAEGFEKETEFLRRALTSPATAPFKIQAENVTPEEILPKDLADHDIIIVSSLSSLPQPLVLAIQSWVRRGGGLILSVGPGTAERPFDPAAFNATYAGLTPANLGKPLRDKFDEERFLSIQPSDLQLPLLREFESTDNGDISAARIYNNYQLAEANDADQAAPKARTLLSLSNADPLVLESSYGKGHVILFTTTLSGAWNSLVVSHSYVPLLYRLINYASSFAAPAKNIGPGEPIIADVSGHDGDLFMTTPDAKLIKVAPVEVGNKRYVRFEATQIAGVYDLQDAKGGPIASFSVSQISTESDLRTLDPDQAAKYTAVLDSPISSTPAELKRDLWRNTDGTETAVWLFVAAILIFLLDATLTRVWFS